LKFQGQVKRRSRFRKPKLISLLIPALLIAVAFFFYTINSRLTPIYVEYAEVQTEKIASYVISKAISDRIANVLDVNDVIENLPTDTPNMVTTKFNTEIINRVLADTKLLVEEHLEKAESGNLDMLPLGDNIEYDPLKMEEQGGVVFYVPVGQATNIPLLGNLGPKIPMRFHVIGDVQADVEAGITEFGINNAYIEVNIIIQVNVKIIVPLATKMSTVEQKIPVAMGLVQGNVPHIFSQGEGLRSPSFEVPIEMPTTK